nr:MAG TPA: hypothetical protein [Caudoviricetes sp.]
MYMVPSFHPTAFILLDRTGIKLYISILTSFQKEIVTHRKSEKVCYEHTKGE